MTEPTTEPTTVETESRPHYERWEQMRRNSVWTSELRAFAKKSDLVVVYFDTVSDAPCWHTDAAFVELKFVQESNKDTETTMHVKFAGHIGTGYRDDLRTMSREYQWTEYSHEPENLYRPTGGAWLLHLYPRQAHHPHSCFMAIPSKATVEFRVRLDYATTSALAESRLHGDLLTVETTKDRKRQGFTLDTQISKHNSARFGF